MERFALMLATALAAAVPAPAQHCPGQGSTPVPATWEPGPDLLCQLARGWPTWHLFTPPHRAVVHKPGFQQGDARERDRLLVHYRCTGWLLLPVVVDRVRTMGYVLDVDEVPCQPALSIAP